MEEGAVMGNDIQRLNAAFDKTKRMHRAEREANRFCALGVSFFRIKLEECRRFFRQRFLPNKFYLIVTVSLAA